MKEKNYEIDMCHGPLLGKILVFTIPLMLSGILQLLFNAMDMIVVGQYSGSDSLGAVGATTSLINLLVNSFLGLSVGANVLVAHYYGASLKKDLDETIHTAMLLSVVGGIAVGAIGFTFCEPILTIMKTPADILPLSVTYMKIYFIGVPALLVYNFGSSILRAIGDTKRPLYFLSISGVVNIGLNLLFVIKFHQGVAGVAYATIISETLSAIMVIICLIRNKGACTLVISHLKMNGDKVLRMIKIGVPAGLQGAIFSLSNMLIQSSVNSFGPVAVAGNTATSSIEGFVYTAMNSFHQSALSFTSQNIGGNQIKRVGKILRICLLCVAVVGTVLGITCAIFGSQLLYIYSSDPEVISYGLIRVNVILITYALCGMMDVFVGSLRGMGYSITPMIVSLLGACGFRILWIFTIFKEYHTLTNLYISYPISWLITGSVHFICFLIFYKKLKLKSSLQ